MPARQDSYTVSIPVSPPPPSDMNTYQRFMHDHTRRQMDAANRSCHRRSGRGSVASQSSNGSSTASA